MGMEPQQQVPGMQANHSQGGEAVELSREELKPERSRTEDAEERMQVVRDTVAFFQERIAGRGKAVHPDVMTGLCTLVHGLLLPPEDT